MSRIEKKAVAEDELENVSGGNLFRRPDPAAQEAAGPVSGAIAEDALLGAVEPVLIDPDADISPVFSAIKR